jgi:hypothetical protein
MNKIFILAEPVPGHFNPFKPIIRKYVKRGQNARFLISRLFTDLQQHVNELRKSVEYLRFEFPVIFRFIGSVVLPPKEGNQQPAWRQDSEYIQHD